MMDDNGILIEVEEEQEKSFSELVERLKRYRDFLKGIEKGIEEWLPSSGILHRDHPLLPVLFGIKRVIDDIDKTIEVYSE
jgi:hypothetical protein